MKIEPHIQRVLREVDWHLACVEHEHVEPACVVEGPHCAFCGGPWPCGTIRTAVLSKYLVQSARIFDKYRPPKRQRYSGEGQA